MSIHTRLQNQSSIRAWMSTIKAYRTAIEAVVAQIAELEVRIADMARSGESTDVQRGTLLSAQDMHRRYVKTLTDNRAQLKRYVEDELAYNLHPMLSGADYRQWRWEARYCTHFSSKHTMQASFKALGTSVAEYMRDEDYDGLVTLIDCLSAYIPAGAVQHVRPRLVAAYERKFEGAPFYCGNCNTWHAHDVGRHEVRTGSRGSTTREWCEQCADDDSVWSDTQGERIMEANAIPLYRSFDAYTDRERDDWLSYSYANDRYYLVTHHYDGSRCALDEDTYAWWSDEWGDGDQNPSQLRSYHSGERVGLIEPTEFTQRKNRVYVGCELEIEFHHEVGGDTSSRRARRRCLRDIAENSDLIGTYMIPEHDGSLNMGFECVTGYSGLDVHRHRMPELLDIIETHNALDGHETTGFHVHVSRAGMTPLHVAKLMTLIYDGRNRDWIESVAGREFGEYRTDLNHEELIRSMCDRARQRRRQGYVGNEYKHWVTDAVKEDVTRYAALSFNTSTGGRTVEFRMFRGTLHNDTIQAYLEFAFACWHFSHQNGIKDMTPEAFAKFICRADNRADTKYLRAYMALRDHRVRTEEQRYVKPVKGNRVRKEKKPAKAA